MTPALASGYGGFYLGPMQLALPVTALREVVPCASLVALPTNAACVAGAIDLRGVLVPVLDLHRVLQGVHGAPRPHAPRPSVIIVVHNGHIMGLLVDSVTGVFDGLAGSMHAMHHPGQAAATPHHGLLAGSVRRATDGASIGVLSPQALAALPDMPWLADPEPDRGQPHGDMAAPGHQPAQGTPTQTMLLRCAGTLLAIDAMAVHATVAVPGVQASALAVGACRGVLPFHGRPLPVVDLLALTGLGRMSTDGPLQAVVLAIGTGLVGLLVDAVLDVVHTQADDVVAVPAFALAEPALFAGALRHAVGNGGGSAGAPVTDARQPMGLAQQVQQYLVLDGDALKRCSVLAALATVAQDRTSGGKGEGTPAMAEARPMITFVLVDEVAVPLDQVAEILPYRADMANLPRRGALLGLLVDRNRTIPVLCLRQLAGAPPAEPTAETSVLVVQSGAEQVGFAVPRLRSIEPARWEPTLPPQGMGAHDMLTHALGSRQMALLWDARGERMLRVLELRHIADALCDGRLAA